MAGFHAVIARSVRECAYRHRPEGELNLSEEIRVRLEALGTLK